MNDAGTRRWWRRRGLPGENGWMRYSNWNEAGGTKRCDDRKETVEKAGEDSRKVLKSRQHQVTR